MTDGIDKARALLTPPVKSENPWALLGAASLAAMAAVLMAGIIVLGPGVRIDEAAVGAEQTPY